MKRAESSERVYGNPNENETVPQSTPTSRSNNFQSHEKYNNNFAPSEYERLDFKIDPVQFPGMLVNYTSPPDSTQGNTFDYDIDTNVRFQEYQTAPGSIFSLDVPLLTDSEFLPKSSLPPSASQSQKIEGKTTKSANHTNLTQELINLRSTPVHLMDSNVKVKSAHNVIEQRYRNKINDKFNALQYSVPTLRTLRGKREAKKSEDELKGSDLDDLYDLESSSGSLEGLEPATKLNKGTILAKTVEYIKFLESKNKTLLLEHQQMLLKAEMLGLRVNEDSDMRENK